MNWINPSAHRLFSRAFTIGAVLVITLAVLSGSCSKTAAPPGSASLILVNATVGADTLVTNFNGGGQPLNYYRNAYQLYYGKYKVTDEMNYYSGAQPLALYKYRDTLDHSTPLFNLTLHLPVSSMFTLFLTGTVTNPDTLLVNENPPTYPASDSVAGIRFVNLSPGSAPISINIKGQPSGSEYSSLPYKSITAFKAYPATKALGSYIFEIRDAAKDSVLTTFTASGLATAGASYATNNWLYKTSTIAFIGLPGGAGASIQKTYKINTF